MGLQVRAEGSMMGVHSKLLNLGENKLQGITLSFHNSRSTRSMAGNYLHRHNPVYSSYPTSPPRSIQASPSISNRSWDDFREEESPEFGGHRDLSALTESLGISWNQVRDLVNAIVQLAGNQPNAKNWGKTVIEPFEQRWSQELPAARSKIYQRLSSTFERIKWLPEKDRHLESFVFTGQIGSHL